MSEVGRAPPGSLLVALAGGLVGAIVGGAAYAALWMAMQPGATARDAAHAALAGGPLSGPQAPFVVAGALLGFLGVGALVGNRLAVRTLAGVGRVLGLAVGTAVGVAFGALAYVAAWVAADASRSWADGLAQLRAAFGDPADPLAAFLLAGAIAGFAAALSLVGRGLFKAGFRVLGGGAAGASAGLVVFCFAAVLVEPVLPHGAMAWVAALGHAGASLAPSEWVFVLLGVVTGAGLSRHAWRMYGIMAFLSLLFVVLGYILYSVTVTLPLVPAADRVFSGVLFVAETASLLMVLLYSFYTLDVASRKHWHRSPPRSRFSPYYLPKVAIHVPSYNEPPEMVLQTLRTLLALDYPLDRYAIFFGDDSTREEFSAPVREFCKANGIAYHHRTDRTGFKAGALNHLLRHTPKDFNLLAVVDADYQVEPEFLRETVGYFIDSDLGWLQTPQDYRNRHQSFLTEQYYLADAYFYRTILPSRNEENSIIFCGTMGILRRRALDEVGGWGEEYVTEDAELSVRMLNVGWQSLYVNKTYGRGLIPATFEEYKRQHHRWAFGGGRILRGHLGRFLFGRFTSRQRLDYLVGTANWFEGGFILAIALCVLGVGVLDGLGYPVVTHHSGEILLVGLVPVLLLLDGLARVHLVLRRSVHLTFGGTLRMLGMWFSVKFSNMLAALKGFLGLKIAFSRTLKETAEQPSKGEAVRRALRATRFESAFAALFTLTALANLLHDVLDPARSTVEAIGRGFLVFWLSYYALLFAAAPLYAYKSLVTLQPDLPEAPVLFEETFAGGPAP